MKNGIICLGEALIDFIPLDESNLIYQKSPGGAPANVAVGLARLGNRSLFLGKVGDDVLGKFLIETLMNYRVETSHMYKTKDARTGAVFVTLSNQGERSFDFYIDPSADRFLQPEEVDPSLFQTCKLLHFGSISLISEPARSATIRAAELAKQNGMLVSYDPNLRLGLWESEDHARAAIQSMLQRADVLKLSDEELFFLTGETDIESGLNALEPYQIPLLFVTLGEKGSYAVTKHGYSHVPAQKVTAVDTTGAGDAYVSGILHKLHERTNGIENITIEEACEMARFASISGGLAASVKGAMTALPQLEDIMHHVSAKK